MSIDKGEKYHRKIYDINGKTYIIADTYRVCDAYDLTTGESHATKKILASGDRGSKSKIQDLEEAITALEAELKYLKGRKDNAKTTI